MTFTVPYTSHLKEFIFKTQHHFQASDDDRRLASLSPFLNRDRRIWRRRLGRPEAQLPARLAHSRHQEPLQLLSASFATKQP
jgi:hypothetical protein